MFDAGPHSLVFRPFPQSDAYAAAARACGAQVFRADLGCGTALVLQRPGRRLVSRGPVWDESATQTDRKKALRRLARYAGVTIVTPEEPMAGFGLVPLVTPTHHAVWDLSCDLRAGLAGKWRNRLAAAERAGLRVVRGGTRSLTALIAAEAAQRRARNYSTHSAAFTAALPVQSLRIFDWRHGGVLGAGMVFVVEGQTATYHLGWAGEAAKSGGVHPLMLMRAAEALAEEGVRWLDLGSVNTEDAPGLARFKLGTGAALKQLGSTLLVLPVGLGI